jgi:hypothetical protein
MSSFRRTLTVSRRATGDYNAGGFYEVSDAPSTFTIEASVQPMSGQEMKLLPENRREEEWTKIYTDTELYSAEKGSTGNADIVTIAGNSYEVFKIFPWLNGVINHYKVFLSKRTTNDAVPPLEEA